VSGTRRYQLWRLTLNQCSYQRSPPMQLSKISTNAAIKDLHEECFKLIIIEERAATEQYPWKRRWLNLLYSLCISLLKHFRDVIHNYLKNSMTSHCNVKASMTSYLFWEFHFNLLYSLCISLLKHFRDVVRILRIPWRHIVTLNFHRNISETDQESVADC